jgi:lipopolysaccharide transport system ATP-binding protein
MSDVILSVENVSKLYRLGTVGTGTFGGDVHRFWKTKILGQEDPFLKIGQTNDRTSKEKVEFVWALQDINFEVKRGEVLGIIGKNGAGKSTLLKLLSRITSPTKGSIKSAGRMASLLEVGTGFHPELTGRENIYLNGAILGMTKKEIQSKFDEIVDFSGCEMYIDTPTKRYSSGMTVRLGFAVAAFLDPEILVVDEVLAVGDAEFQKKAIDKMKKISTSENRTILFVSHSMSAIKNLTEKVIWMEFGKIKKIGSTEKVVDEYLNGIVLKDKVVTNIYNEENWTVVKADWLTNKLIIKQLVLLNNSQLIRSNEIIRANITLENKSSEDLFDNYIYWRISDLNSNHVTTGSVKINDKISKTQELDLELVFSSNFLSKGKYYSTIWVGKGDFDGYGEDYFSVTDVLYFEIYENSGFEWSDKWGNVKNTQLKITNQV